MEPVDFFTYLAYYHPRFASATLEHLLIVVYSLPPAILIGVGTGSLLAGRPRLARVALGLASVIMTVPSLALFALMVATLAPFGLGLGPAPAVLAIVLYSLLPIMRNTTTALENVDPGALEAARGLGLSPTGVLWRVRLPLALPLVMAGIRTAMVTGGLGYFVLAGIARSNVYMVATGAVLIAGLAISANQVLLKLETLLAPWRKP